MVREVIINGKSESIPAEISRVSELVVHLGLRDRRIAVERNEKIVPRAAHPETPVEDGDVFEILQFVGGGTE